MVAYYMFFVSIICTCLSRALAGHSIVGGHVDPLTDLMGLLHSAQEELHRQEDTEIESFAQAMAACAEAGLDGITENRNVSTVKAPRQTAIQTALLTNANRLDCVAKAKHHEAWEKRHKKESSAVRDVLDMVSSSDALHVSIQSSPVLQKQHTQQQVLRGWKAYHSPSSQSNSMLLSVSQDEIETLPIGSVESSVSPTERRSRQGKTMEAAGSQGAQSSSTKKSEASTSPVGTKSLAVSEHVTVVPHISPNLAVAEADKVPCQVGVERQKASLLQQNLDITELGAEIEVRASKIEDLHRSLTQMDRRVMQLTSARKQEHQVSVNAASARVAASKVIEHAIAIFEMCGIPRGAALQGVDTRSDKFSTAARKEKIQSSLRHLVTKAEEDQGTSNPEMGLKYIPEIGESMVMLDQLRANLDAAASSAVKEEAHAVQEYAKAMSSSADQREVVTVELAQSMKAEAAVDELQKRRLKLMNEREQVQEHLELLQRKCGSSEVKNSTMIDADALELKIRKHFGENNYYMITIFGLAVVCTVLACVLACVCRQLLLFSRRRRGRQFHAASPESSARLSQRTQLPDYTTALHGPVQATEVHRPAGSSFDPVHQPPTPSFLPPRPGVDIRPPSQEPVGGILKKTPSGSPCKTPDPVPSEESGSIWGAWSGHELTDEQIDMMVREAEARQRQEQLRQHLVDEGRETLTDKPRPWWKPDKSPLLSPQHSISSSVPTLLKADGNSPPLPERAPSSSLRPTSDDRMIQGVSMLQPQSEMAQSLGPGSHKSQSLGPGSSFDRRSAGERAYHSMGPFNTPLTKQGRSSLGSDAFRGNVSLPFTPPYSPKLYSGRDVPLDQATPQSVVTPGKWLWSPKSASRSLTPPAGPCEPSPRRTHQARPRSIGGTTGLSGLNSQGGKGPTPPESSRSAVLIDAPMPSQLPQPQLVQQFVQQYGGTPPPTPPSLIRGNNGQQIVVPPLVPPIWRNFTPPSSARDRYLMRSPGQQR